MLFFLRARTRLLFTSPSLGRVVQLVLHHLREHLEVLAHTLPVLGGDHLEVVLGAGHNLDLEAPGRRIEGCVEGSGSVLTLDFGDSLNFDSVPI